MSLILNQKTNNFGYIANDSGKRVGTISYSDVNQGVDPVDSVVLEDGCKFQFAPKPVKELERMTMFVAGESGAGESYFIREYAKRYKAMFPNNPNYLISYLKYDETLDAYKEIIRIYAFKERFLEKCLDLDLVNEFSNSFVIFDDVDSIVNKKTKEKIFGLLNKFLRIGRYYYELVIPDMNYTLHTN